MDARTQLLISVGLVLAWRMGALFASGIVGLRLAPMLDKRRRIRDGFTPQKMVERLHAELAAEANHADR